MGNYCNNKLLAFAHMIFCMCEVCVFNKYVVWLGFITCKKMQLVIGVTYNKLYFFGSLPMLHFAIYFCVVGITLSCFADSKVISGRHEKY